MSTEARRPGTTIVLLVAALAAIIGVYAFFISAGFSTKTLPSQRYYNMLADAFVAKQLHLKQLPESALLAQADPYDYQTSRRFWKLWDASLYEGKYYFYWGPVPALAIAGVKLVSGRNTIIPDRTVVLVCSVGRLLIGAWLFFLVQRWLLPWLPAWAPAAALLVFGLANPYLYEMGRPGIYEAAIDSAQLFLLSGVLAAFVAIHGCRTRARELLLLAAAGWCWALALGCRVSLLFAVAALTVLTALADSLRGPRRFRSFATCFVVLATPIAVGLLGLGWYNFARFGSFADFGTSYMLSRRPYVPSLSLVLPNLEAYVFRRFDVSCQFPYLSAPFFANRLTPAWVRPEWGYVPKEPLVGLLFGTPGVIFAVAAVAEATAGLSRWRNHGVDAKSETRIVPLAMTYLVGAMTAIVLFAGLPSLGVWFSSMRYLADINSGALILAILGFWICLRRTSSSAQGWKVHGIACVGAVLAIYMVVVSVLLGFQGGYFGVIKKHNPALHTKLETNLSFCRNEPRRTRPVTTPSASTRRGN